MSEKSGPAFAELVQRELSCNPKPFGDSRPSPLRIVDPSEDLCGLALSGGGIRSATFNLGLLQGLHRLDLLRSFDYLSTVSGGGYVGSFWSAWRSREANHGKTFPEVPGWPESPEPREIRHVREFRNFLAPRVGILSWDTGRLLVAALASMLPSLLAAFSILLLAVLAWCGIVYALFAQQAWLPSVSPLTFSSSVLGGLTAVLLVGLEASWKRREEETSDRAYITAALAAVAVTVGTWILISGHTELAGVYAAGQILPKVHPDRWVYLVGPVVAWGAALLAFTLLRWATSSLANTYEMRMARTAHDRAHSRVLLMTVVWLVFAALWCVGVWLESRLRQWGPAMGTGIAGLSTAGTALFVWLQQRLGREPNRPAGAKLTAVLRPLLPQILAYAVLSTSAVLTVALLLVIDQKPKSGAEVPLGIAAGAILIVVAVLWFLDPNEVGLHAFYRGRIARAYLGASVPVGWRKTEEQATDDFALQFLNGSNPCHLICCAANDLADSGDLRNMNRGAESAVLSRVGFSVAECWAPWQHGKVVPTLASAITASGAAFNSLMGSKSVEYGPAVTFLMAAFNLRLGLWWPHPTLSKEQSLAERTLVGLPFFKEMFGIARSRGRDVHLSDGAHFENLGAYELIRRHCRVIVVSDCGMDPDVAFDDFANLVRRVREDFGVNIRIDLTPLRPDPETGIARQPMVAGDIHYPEGDSGILLLFKPTIVGNEPADVLQYGRRNREFPHETTGDQFYDEAQWESYRRLGEHAALSAFRKLTVGLNRAAPENGYASQVFSRARREWLPVPEGFADRVSRLADRLVELDALLRDEHAEGLLREVYKEVDELDRWAKKRPGDDPTTASPEAQPPRPPAVAHTDAPADELARTGGADGANGEAGAPEAAVLDTPLPQFDAMSEYPAGAHLYTSLHLIRRALLVFQEAYEREDLPRNYHHPVYLGLMNYMARWAYAPLFRMWWPLLKTLYPQPFTRFMEERFGLAQIGSDGEADERVVTRLSLEREGFAMEAWERQGGGRPPSDGDVVSYTLRMCYRDVKPPYDIQAAQVLVAAAGNTLVWDADDFFVPPGLWGVGIGEDFLRRLRTGECPVGAAERLLTRVRVRSGDSGWSHKETTDTLQLYRSSGFSRICYTALSGAEQEAFVRRDASVPRAHTSGSVDDFRWFYVDLPRRAAHP